MEGGHGATGGYRFDVFELSVRVREVFDRRCAAPLRLQRKMFEVLLYLLEQRGRIVSKDELVCEVWGGIALSGGAVPQCISMLRKALGDTGREQRILKTHYGRGYRFVCSASRIRDEETAEPTAGPCDMSQAAGAEFWKRA